MFPYIISEEEREISSILVSCISLYGNNGVPISEINEEFEGFCGYPIPYRKFGCDSLKSFLITLPDIFIVKDEFNNEIIIEQSVKTKHVKNLIVKQKNKSSSKKRPQFDQTNFYSNKKRRPNPNQLPKGSSIHTSINKISLNNSDRYEEFEKLEAMLPLIYKHQALGDDFFVDLADRKLGYYVSDTEPLTCGLCEVGQTIAQLTEKVQQTHNLAPRVLVMIGMNDLLQRRNANNMITDLRKLVYELKNKNSRVTLMTLIPSPKLIQNNQINLRFDIFNNAILEYAYDPDLQCNIIDMNCIFRSEMYNFKKDLDRLDKIARNDTIRVFSDYGRKIFLNALKSCLKEQIKSGH